MVNTNKKRIQTFVVLTTSGVRRNLLNGRHKDTSSLELSVYDYTSGWHGWRSNITTFGGVTVFSFQKKHAEVGTESSSDVQEIILLGVGDVGLFPFFIWHFKLAHCRCSFWFRELANSTRTMSRSSETHYNFVASTISDHLHWGIRATL